jgi:DNA mismatch repair protein MutL
VAPRAIPENRAAAGRNQFAEPVVAREPAAPRFASSGSAPRPTGANYPHASTGYQKQQGANYRKLLETPAAERRSADVAPTTETLEGHSQSFGRVLTIVAPDTALLERDGKLALLALPVAERWLKQAQLTPGDHRACAQPLLIPVRLKISPDETRVLQRFQAPLAEMGIETAVEAQHVTLRAVPLPLRQQNLQNLIPELIGYLAQQTTFDAGNTAQWIARHLASDHPVWSMAQAITVLAEVERLCPHLVKAPPGGLLQPVDLQSAKNALKDE